MRHTLEMAFLYLSIAKSIKFLTFIFPSPTGTIQRTSPKFIITFIILLFFLSFSIVFSSYLSIFLLITSLFFLSNY